MPEHVRMSGQGKFCFFTICADCKPCRFSVQRLRFSLIKKAQTTEVERALIWKRNCYLFTLFKIFKVFIAAHFCGSHICLNNIKPNFFIFRNHYSSQTSLTRIRPMIAMLSFKNKSGLYKNAFQNLPVNCNYAWQS